MAISVWIISFLSFAHCTLWKKLTRSSKNETPQVEVVTPQFEIPELGKKFFSGLCWRQEKLYECHWSTKLPDLKECPHGPGTFDLKPHEERLVVVVPHLKDKEFSVSFEKELFQDEVNAQAFYVSRTNPNLDPIWLSFDSGKVEIHMQRGSWLLKTHLKSESPLLSVSFEAPFVEHGCQGS
jgi:hypothetical protein